MEINDTEEKLQDPIPSTSKHASENNINFIKREPVLQSIKPHTVMKCEPSEKFEFVVKSEPTDSSDDQMLEEVEPEYVAESDIKSEFDMVKEESIDLDDDVKAEIEMDAEDESVQSSFVPEAANSTQTNQEPKRRQNHQIILREKPCRYCIKMFRCPCCTDMFQSKSEVVNHILSTHKDQMKDTALILTSKIHKSNRCNHEISQTTSFKKHLMLNRTKRFICMFCSEHFHTKQNLNNHLLHQHTNILGDDLDKTTFTLHTCNLCIYDTVRPEDYQRHLSYHEQNPGKFKCETCGHECSSRVNLLYHLRSHFGTNLFRCIFCQKHFPIRLDYQSHLMINHKQQVENLKEVMMHKCTECSFTTVLANKFKRHEATHGRSSSVKEQLCGKREVKTDHLGSLRRHDMSKHLGTSRFVCSECSKGYDYKIFLDDHILEAHGKNQELRDMVTSKFYKCDKCAFETIFMRNLVKHRSFYHKL